MITYIINTSENKTFDSENLFSLVGYNKIVWMTSRLDNIKKCAMEIYEKQNALGVDSFRVAVIVDFFNFDKIRHPYGENGYKKDKEMVDIAVYLPFIEAFLVDNLFDVLMRKHLYIEQKDIFYAQNCAVSDIDNIDNAKEQVKLVLTPCKISDDEKNKKIANLDKNDEKIIEKNRAQSIEREKKRVKKEVEDRLNKTLDDLANALSNGRITEAELKEESVIAKKKAKEEEIRLMQEIDKSYETYCQFSLHCTDLMSLEFKTTDYPYGGSEFITFKEFYENLISRNVQHKQIRRYYYYNPNSTTKIMAAYDTLTLCLHLIETYEQEESLKYDGEIKIKNICPEKLRDVLILSWNKVRKAREVARENKIKYYDIQKIINDIHPYDIIIDEENEIEVNIKEKVYDETIEEAYAKIKLFSSHTSLGMSDDNLNELNKIVSNYLEKRDLNREIEINNEFDSEINGDTFKTSKCPSKVVYEKLAKEKEVEISNIFKKTLKSEYISVNYDEEGKEADLIMMKYNKLKEYKKGKPIATIIFSIYAALIIIIPYMLLQRRFEGIFSISSIVLYGIHFGVVVGSLFLSFMIFDLFYKFRIERLRKKMLKCLKLCDEKNELSMSKFRERYKSHLLTIEKLRYIVREINRIQQLNNQIETHVKIHRIELEVLENHLSSILNNLGIEPIVDNNINIQNEFSIELPVKSPQNKVYKIFSLEVIEELFEDNGGDL